MTRYRAAMTVSAATLLVGGPAWALPQPAVPAAAAPSHSDLEVVRIDPDPAPPGGTTTIHGFVANLGPETTNSPMTVTITLPRGATPEAPYFPDTCETSPSGRQVRCVFPPGLKKDRSATAQVPVSLDRDLEVGTTLRGGSVAVHSPDDRNGENNRQEFEIAVVETAPGL
ncbi:hypothetical protein [Streptomyces sp. SPB4]|uniref:hypothetical protein n=1 Tax=Streptomyces sp. SPB4 TaxID=2940553 RepID=UPI00247538FD|nr:hypothetical protein [Streptomyces sp. SPB4]MDH6538556.1 hypothetical protein [Streptomyces sp. SPB4]